MNKKRFAGITSMALAGTLALALVGCGGATPAAKDAGSAEATKSTYKVAMVTDMGGVNDQSFNQLAWEGLQQLSKDTGIKVGYTESKQEADYAPNLDKATDQGNDLVWGIGFAMSKAIQEHAKKNPDVHVAIIDSAYGDAEQLDNLTGVTFRSQEPSFVVGYIAAMTSQTGKVGFVGGVKSDVLNTFEYGYRAGVAYANKENGKNVEVSVQYLETFTDAAKGKAAGQKLYADGCDVIFQAAGNAGNGVIEAAVDANKLVIGVDKDQHAQAPENVLTSALKRVDKAVIEVSEMASKGKEIGRQNINLGMAEDAAGISEHHELMSDDVYQKALDLVKQIKDGKIMPPASEKDFNSYTASL
ncbi:BMP family ABC transporter substrate-binding protein [Collinsella sp. zg1085]|uniref:BMP family lipoprotein n=1 Tax=Collinsella sp. zg1085 TaxID=2844380 RepID=UPI001C0B14AC|nr:BMP family ABC transporter substrate-binding protein [Collinsella sp. zg1085]QWT17396.1 BMP family ABC transporter substrate-binding protein [Collinsella sp. zg1085]